MSTNIISTNGRIFLNDSERGLQYLFPYTKPKIGEEVFWVDPCFWRGDEHTSRWAEVTDIRGEIIELDNGTEVTIDELYL